MLVHLSSFHTANEGRKCMDVYRSLLPLTSMCHIMPIPASHSLCSSFIAHPSIAHFFASNGASIVPRMCVYVETMQTNGLRASDAIEKWRMKISILLISIDVFTMPSETILPFINSTDFCVRIDSYFADGRWTTMRNTYNNNRCRFRALNSLIWKKRVKKPSSHARVLSTTLLKCATAWFFLSFLFDFYRENVSFFHYFGVKSVISFQLEIIETLPIMSKSKYLIAYSWLGSKRVLASGMKYQRPTRRYFVSAFDRRSCIVGSPVYEYAFRRWLGSRTMYDRPMRLLTIIESK